MTQVNNGDIITTYSYDANGNLLSETTGGNHSTFTYDDANRMTGLVNSYPSADIEGETVTETESYTYYPNGNKKTVTDMTGKLIHYTYDNAGRLTAETVDDAVTSYTYDGYNNRIGKVENGVQTSYLYDNRNRLTKE
ncbi:MAG: RHS repeat protein, partial [Clostridia bacterium]|nr:RHS repeat protein [Clostridia bacterium]